MFWSLKAHFNLTLSYMDTSYHLGWQTEEALHEKTTVIYYNALNIW